MPQKKPPTPATGPLDAFVKRPEPPKRMGRPPKRKRGGGRPKKKMNNKENDTESDDGLSKPTCILELPWHHRTGGSRHDHCG